MASINSQLGAKRPHTDEAPSSKKSQHDDKICSVCLEERFRCPVEICSNKHCLDIGCLINLVRTTPEGHDVRCPLDRSVIDLSKLIYRHDIVKEQGPWIEVERYERGEQPPLKFTIAPNTKVAELAPIWRNPSKTTTDQELSNLCRLVRSISLNCFVPIAQMDRLTPPQAPLFPDDLIARPEDLHKTVQIYACTFFPAYCRECALAIEQSSSFLARKNLITICITAGHTNVLFTSEE